MRTTNLALLSVCLLAVLTPRLAHAGEQGDPVGGGGDQGVQKGELLGSIYGFKAVTYRFWLGIPWEGGMWPTLDAATLATTRKEFRDDLQAVLSNALGLNPERITYDSEETPGPSTLVSPFGLPDPRLYVQVTIAMPDYEFFVDPAAQVPMWAWTGGETGAWFSAKWSLEPFKCKTMADFYAPGKPKDPKLCSYGLALHSDDGTPPGSPEEPSSDGGAIEDSNTLEESSDGETWEESSDMEESSGEILGGEEASGMAKRRSLRADRAWLFAA